MNARSRIHLNIKTNLAVFSFSNAFLNFKKQTEKRNKEVETCSNSRDTNIYNYIQYI